MFKWFRRKKQEPNDGRQEKRESMRLKREAAEALMRALKGEGYDRRHEVVSDFSPDRRNA